MSGPASSMSTRTGCSRSRPPSSATPPSPSGRSPCCSTSTGLFAARTAETRPPATQLADERKHTIMPLTDQIPEPIRKPTYAVVGAGDAVVERLRGIDVDPKHLQEQAKEFPTKAQAKAAEAQVKASERFSTVAEDVKHLPEKLRSLPEK